MNKFKKLSISAFTLMLFTGGAHAAAEFCSGAAPFTSNADGLLTSDITYDGNNADDCYGVKSGNDSQDAINNLGAQAIGVDLWGASTDAWTSLAKDDIGTANDGAGSYMGIDFQLTAANGTFGNWTLTGTDTNGTNPLNLPATLDFVAVLKGSNGYGAWLLDDVIVNNGNNQGTWNMSFHTNPKANSVADLSHFSLYVREGDITITRVPEPAAMALFGLGLMSLVYIRRRTS